MVKLLSPFAGLRFACGHATIHLAFFFGSFSVTTLRGRVLPSQEI